ncbi:hypothetical protein HOG21_05810 [bacterium]|nr:hypothetical protein [bacterium]
MDFEYISKSENLLTSPYISASYISVLLELISTTKGSNASSGSSILSTLSLISVRASLVSTHVSSSIVTIDVHTHDVELIFFTQSTLSISFSIFSVIKVSIETGLTHG